MDTTMSDPISNEISQSDMLQQEQSLTQLLDLIPLLEAQPGDIALLKQHLSLAKKAGMEDQVGNALEMLVRAVGCGSDIWIELLDRIEQEIQSPDLQPERLSIIIQLVELALSDYYYEEIPRKICSILLLLSPIPSSTPEQPSSETVSEQKEPLLPEPEVRRLFRLAVTVSEVSLSSTNVIWSKYIQWEQFQALLKPDGEERLAALRSMHGRFLGRLAVPGVHLEETSQIYSTFNTTHFELDYEANMIKGSNVMSKSMAKYQAREGLESSWTDLCAQGDSPELRQQKLAFLAAWLEWETNVPEPAKNSKGKGREGDAPKLEPRCVIGVYERMLTLLSTWGEGGKVLEAGVWVGYWRFMANTNGISKADTAKVLERGVRCCPSSGELWATLLRAQEGNGRDSDVVTETYMRALGTGQLTTEKGGSVDELVTLEMAWGGYIRRALGDIEDEPEDDEMESMDAVETTLRESIDRVKMFFPKGDPAFKLDSYLISWLERKGKIEQAMKVWEGVSKSHGKSYLAWTGYAEFLIRHNEYPKARSVLKIASNRQGLDWPEAVWAVWITFEERYGSVDNVSAAQAKVATLTDALNKKRQQETAAAAAAAPAQYYAQEPVVATEILAVDAEMTEPDSTRKRKAEDSIDGQVEKRVKVETEEPAVATLQRDREFSTVLVSGLTADVTEDMIKDRFKDCGEVREVTITVKGDSAVAAVEFMSRDTVPAALTKDKKTIGETQINVYQAGQTTLFVTNFPETMDDEKLRELFAPYGEILETRWPSKKYKDSRRFCYVQFLTTSSAHSATELNGRELEPDMPLTALISDPERKKQRSDANADAREIYITGLSRFAAAKDLNRLFDPFGEIKRINIATDDEGHCKGFAFIEFAEELSVRSALVMDGTELKKRKMKVSQADSTKKNNTKSEISPSDKAALSARSVRILGLPEKTQEGLLQQALEKITTVKKLEVFNDKAEALAELSSPADVGTLLLRAEAIVYGGNTLRVVAANASVPAAASKATSAPKAAASTKASPVVASAPVEAASTPEIEMTETSTAPPTTSQSQMFKPRPPRAAGRKKMVNLIAPTPKTSTKPAADVEPSAAKNESAMKGQDDFRKMLLEGKK